MKKVLSILLSVMLILGTVTCLMLLPATADTGTTAPVNLIVNGDAEGVDGKFAYDATDAKKSTYKGQFNENNAYGWRSNVANDSVTYFSNIKWKYYANHNYEGITYTASGNKLLEVNNWGQTAMQDVTLNKDKAYKVSLKIAVAPYTIVTDSEGNDKSLVFGNKGFDVFFDNGVNSVSNPEESIPSGKTYNLVGGHTAIETAVKAECDRSDLTKWEIVTDSKGTRRTKQSDFTNYSFTFKASDFLADYTDITPDSDGNFTARFCVYNPLGTVLLFDDVTMYEVYAITAGEGGTVDTDAVICGTTATVKATPYYGNTFNGWYNGETLVSSDATYTGVISANLTAKFNVYNQIPDGNFAASVVGDTSPLAMSKSGDYSTSYKPSFEVVANTEHTDVLGDKVVKWTSNAAAADATRSQYDMCFPVTVEKNKKYLFRFYYKATGTTENNIDTAKYVGYTIAEKMSWNAGAIIKYSAQMNPYGTTNKTEKNTNFAEEGMLDSNQCIRYINNNYSKTEWNEMLVLFDSLENEGDIYAVIGMVQRSDYGNCDVYLANLQFSEISADNVKDGAYVADGGTYTVSGAGTLNETFKFTTNESGKTVTWDTTEYTVKETNDVESNITLSAHPANGNTFKGWYDGEKLISSSNPYTATKVLTPKFDGINSISYGDFEDEVSLDGIVSTLNNLTTISYGTYTDADKACVGYTESMGDKYLFVKKGNGSTGNANIMDVAFPFDIEQGKKYLAHFKIRTISNDATYTSEEPDAEGKLYHSGNRLDIQVRGAANVWAVPANYGATSFLVLSDDSYILNSKSYQCGSWNLYHPSYFGNKSSNKWSANTDKYKDFYAYIDATEMNTATIYIAVGIQSGATYAIDNISFVELDSIAPTLDGASLAVAETADKVVYKTSVNLPEYLAMSKVSTYMIPTSTLTTDNATTFNAETANVGVASVSATDKVLTESGKTFRTGEVYATFSGASKVTQTNKYSARSEVELTDNYGNSLGITLSTGNTNEGLSVTNGVHTRSIQQLKRVLAKSYIAKDDSYAKLAADKITTYPEGGKLYNGNIEQVWNFVRAAYAEENK